MADRELVEAENRVFRSCGHEPPRRICDLCKTRRYAFMACSSACLWAHQRVAHDPETPADTATRARRAQQERTRRSADVWDLFAGQRERLLTLIPPDVAGGTLCVLGAGKCDDLDLPRLARRFKAIHLVDLDGDALEQARDRQSSLVRAALVLHGGVDLSGLLERLDDWGDAFPDDEHLHRAVFSSAYDIAEKLGGPFDVTLSTCVLSQLMIPFQLAWAASEATWSKLSAALAAIHIGTIVRTTAPGGAASLVMDVLSSDDAPALIALRAQPTEELQRTVITWLQTGTAVLQPDPAALLTQIRELGLAAPDPGPTLTGPWLWDSGAASHLVYAVSFRKPS